MRLLAVAAMLAVGCHGDRRAEPDVHMSGYLADLWLEGADVVRILWRDCSKKLIDVKDVIDHKEYFPKFVRCMKRKTLRALDRSLSTDVVPIADGVNLVRFELVDTAGHVMNDTDKGYWSEQELEEGEWRTLALRRLARVLRTHVIKFDLDRDGKAVDKPEYRGRRRHQMMTMMMFGIVSIGMVLVPMGFQFLAVLGGKALLLAKMALILASIQGLKKVDRIDTLDGYNDRPKIATSPVSYGFYHTYPYDHYEGRNLDDWPPPSSAAATPPPTTPHHVWDHLKADRKAQVEFSQELPRVVKTSEVGPRLYPVFNGAPVVTTNSFLSSVDSPTDLVDLTTTPGEVQADYSLDLPFNGFRFQSPTPVVSS